MRLITNVPIVLSSLEAVIHEFLLTGLPQRYYRLLEFKADGHLVLWNSSNSRSLSGSIAVVGEKIVLGATRYNYAGRADPAFVERGYHHSHVEIPLGDPDLLRRLEDTIMRLYNGVI